MRKRWFGDSRDYVKWSCVRREAETGFAVLYGIMLRPDGFDDPLLDEAVVSYFGRLKDFDSLGELFPYGFEVNADEYTRESADQYFENLVLRIKSIQIDRNLLVFLDPDTGIAPQGNLGHEHLRERDIYAVVKALEPGNKLVIYQHAHRSKHWRDSFKTRLECLCKGLDASVSEPFYADGVAKDVCFFTLTKHSN